MRCTHEGCEGRATHFPRLCVPIENHPIDTHLPSSAMIGIYLCEEHCKSLVTKDFIGEDVPGNLRDLFRMITPFHAPDFERAFVTPVSLTTPEAQALEDDLNRSAHLHEAGHA